MAFGIPYFGNNFFGGQYFGHYGGTITVASAGTPPLLGTITLRVMIDDTAVCTISPGILGAVELNGADL